MPFASRGSMVSLIHFMSFSSDLLVALEDFELGRVNAIVGNESLASSISNGVKLWAVCHAPGIRTIVGFVDVILKYVSIPVFELTSCRWG